MAVMTNAQWRMNSYTKSNTMDEYIEHDNKKRAARQKFDWKKQRKKKKK